MNATVARLGRALGSAGVHETPGRAAQAAFYGLLAIFPGLLALLSLTSLLHLRGGLATLRALSRRGIPADVANAVLGELPALDEQHGWALLVTLLVALYYGGQALGAMLSGVALAFGREEQHPLRAALWGVGLTGLLMFAVTVLLALLMTASWLLSWVAALGVLGEGVETLVSLLRWPLLGLVFQQLALGMYRVGAGRSLGPRPFTTGSVVAALLWAVCTVSFESFVGSFRDLGATYGSLAAVVALMMYVQLLCSTVLFGAELDAQS